MSWGAYGLLIIFGAFILLLILNPNMSCFGKRIKSPFYPLLRRKHPVRKTHDYRFRLTDTAESRKMQEPGEKSRKKTEDYGFRLD